MQPADISVGRKAVCEKGETYRQVPTLGTHENKIIMGFKMDFDQTRIRDHVEHKSDSNLVLIGKTLPCDRSALLFRRNVVDGRPNLRHQGS